MENVPQTRSDSLAGVLMIVVAALFVGMALLMRPENWQTAVGTGLVVVQFLVAGSVLLGLTGFDSRSHQGRRVLNLVAVTAIPAAGLLAWGLLA